MANILLVEDYQNLQKIYEATLVMGGHDVDVAADGMKAFDMAADKNYDVIVLDMYLPKMTGLDFLEEFEPKKRNPPVKVIGISNAPNTDMARQAKEHGMDVILEKAHTTPHSLIEKIDKMLESDNPSK